MMLLQLLVGAAVVYVMVLITTVTLGAITTRLRVRRMRRIARERANESEESFVRAMERVGVPSEVSVPLQDQLGKILELYGIHTFRVRSDDPLLGLYGAVLPDAENEFLDPDLRDIVGVVARKSGRAVPAAGQALDDELRQLKTVGELGRWITALGPP